MIKKWWSLQCSKSTPHGQFDINIGIIKTLPLSISKLEKIWTSKKKIPLFWKFSKSQKLKNGRESITQTINKHTNHPCQNQHYQHPNQMNRNRHNPDSHSISANFSNPLRHWAKSHNLNLQLTNDPSENLCLPPSRNNRSYFTSPNRNNLIHELEKLIESTPSGITAERLRCWPQTLSSLSFSNLKNSHTTQHFFFILH